MYYPILPFMSFSNFMVKNRCCLYYVNDIELQTVNGTIFLLSLFVVTIWLFAIIAAIGIP